MIRDEADKYRGGAVWRAPSLGLGYIVMIGSQRNGEHEPDMAVISDPRDHGAMAWSHKMPDGSFKTLLFPDELRAMLDNGWTFVGDMYDLLMEPWEVLAKRGKQ